MDNLLQLTKLALKLKENIDYSQFATEAFELIDNNTGIDSDDLDELYTKLDNDEDLKDNLDNLDSLFIVLHIMLVESVSNVEGFTFLNKSSSSIIKYLMDNFTLEQIKLAEFKQGNCYNSDTLDIDGMEEYTVQFVNESDIESCWEEYAHSICDDCYSLDKLPPFIYNAIDFDFIINQLKLDGEGNAFSGYDSTCDEVLNKAGQLEYYVFHN